MYGLTPRHIVAIAPATGRIAWVGPLGGAIPPAEATPASLSPDGRGVAYLGREEITIADARTGDVVAVHPRAGARHVVYGPGGRVAAVGETVRLFERDRQVAELPVTAAAWTDHLADAVPFAWSPDGTRVAVVDAEGALGVWSAEGERLAGYDLPEGALGVSWGEAGVLAVAAVSWLRFLRAGDGTVVGGFAPGAAAAGPRPLRAGYETIADDYDVDPVFPLDGDTWAVAFGDRDLVIAPPEREADLDAALAWSAYGRYAWPVRWGGTPVVPDAGAAAERIPDVRDPVRAKLRWFAGLEE